MVERTVLRTFTEEVKVQMQPDEVKALVELYAGLWTEACYDPNTEETRKFAAGLLPHIQLLNDRWKFKS